jgi:hypothetical protein
MMPISLIFWVLMLIWLVGEVSVNYGYGGPHAVWGRSLFLFILFALLGWRVFGAAIHN